MGGNTWSGLQFWDALSATVEYMKMSPANTSDPIQRLFRLVTSSHPDDIGIWTGNNAQGNFFITYNAIWNGSTWSQLYSSRVSSALFFRDGRWRLGFRVAGAGTWASWTADGDLSLGTLIALSGTFAGLVSDGSLTSYDPAITVTETLPITMMAGLNCDHDSIYPGAIAPNAAPASAWFSIVVPAGATLGNLRFYHHRQADSYDTIFRMHVRNLAFTDGGATPTLTAVSGATYTESIGAGTGSFEGGFNLSGAGLDAEREYLIEWVNGNSGDRLYGVKLVGTDQISPRAGVR